MATLLDFAFFSHFTPIFVFLLIYAVVFAILTTTKLLTEHKPLNAIIAFAVAGLFLLSVFSVKLVSVAAPYFVVLMLFIVFVLLLVGAFGYGPGEIKSALSSPSYNFVIYFVVIGGLVLITIVLGQVFGQSLLTGPTGEGEVNVNYTGNISTGQNYEQNLWNTIFHPKVLGLIFLLVICSFTIRMLAQSALRQ